MGNVKVEVDWGGPPPSDPSHWETAIAKKLGGYARIEVKIGRSHAGRCVLDALAWATLPPMGATGSAKNTPEGVRARVVKALQDAGISVDAC